MITIYWVISCLFVMGVIWSALEYTETKYSDLSRLEQCALFMALLASPIVTPFLIGVIITWGSFHDR